MSEALKSYNERASQLLDGWIFPDEAASLQAITIIALALEASFNRGIAFARMEDGRTGTADNHRRLAATLDKRADVIWKGEHRG